MDEIATRLNRVARHAKKIYAKRFWLKKSLEVRFNDYVLHFRTESQIAKKWFYPRYGQGSPHEPVLCDYLNRVLPEDAVFLVFLSPSQDQKGMSMHSRWTLSWPRSRLVT